MLNRRKFLQIAAVSSGLAITGTDLLSQAVANASTTVRARRLARHQAHRHPDDGEPLVRPLPGLAARRRRPARPDVRVRGRRQHLPQLPARARLPGLRVQRPRPQLGGLAGPAQRRQDRRLPAAADRPGRQPGRHARRREHVPDRLLQQPDRDGRRKALPDLPVIGALAERYTTLDRYFCAFAGETFPNRFYQHAGQTDRDHNSEAPSTLPTIWDQLSPIANTDGIPTGGYYYQDSPFLALWASPGDRARGDVQVPGVLPPVQPTPTPSTAALSAGTSFVAACENGTLPNVCYIDPAFDNEGTGTSGDDHPLGDIRLGERFIADAYHALADNGYLDDTVFIVTFDEWGGFYDHVPPPRVIDDTNPANVMHAGDSSHPDRRPADPRLPAARLPGARDRGVQPGAAGPGRARGAVRARSSLALIESTFGLYAAHRARPARAEPVRSSCCLSPVPPRFAVRPSSIPTSSDVIGPAISPPSESLLQVLTGTAAYDPAASAQPTACSRCRPIR